jgi:hypothetical protein
VEAELADGRQHGAVRTPVEALEVVSFCDRTLAVPVLSVAVQQYRNVSPRDPFPDSEDLHPRGQARHSDGQRCSSHLSSSTAAAYKDYLTACGYKAKVWQHTLYTHD